MPSDMPLRVEGKLYITGGNQPPGNAADVRVRVEHMPRSHRCILSIRVSPQAEWQLELEPDAAAYIAGGLAIEAGVSFAPR